MSEKSMFLKEKFNLHTSEEVEKASQRKEARTKEKVSKDPESKIQAYLDRFSEIINREDEHDRERGINAIKTKMHDLFVIKEDNVPQGYFELQKRIAKEQGHGDVEINEEMRKEMINTVIIDQKQSLDNWINYLSSDDALYPNWAKYWAFRSISKMSSYDKEKKEFGKRTKSTTTPFPDLNREALSFVVDSIVKKQKQENIEGDDSFQKMLAGANFAKLYAYAIEKVTPASTEQKEQIKGEWIKYDKGSDHTPLYESLQGHGTGWCTAGESTAETQLQTGDFYVYQSYDRENKPTVPRIAIRMQSNDIGEVRGIGPEQNLEPAMIDITEEKLKELPGSEKYKKRYADMRRLTKIDKKINKGEDLTLKEKRFLYEIDSRIEGFGYQKDPRIEEIKEKRDIKQDYADVYNCKKEQVAINLQEFNQDTVVYAGDLDLRGSQIKELPQGLSVGGGLDLRNTQIKELPQGLSVSGYLDLRGSQIKELPEGLSVGGDLDLRGTQIKELPENIKVKGNIIR